MEKKRIDAWFAKELDDSELTAKEITWLEEAVFNAISKKTSERDDVHTFPESKEIH